MSFSQIYKIYPLQGYEINPISVSLQKASTMIWETINIMTESGGTVRAQAPVIVSASQATDIPAFYADWFFDQLGKGYSARTNPFNGMKSYFFYARTQLIIFWSKNPCPLLPYLEKLRERVFAATSTTHSTTTRPKGSNATFCRSTNGVKPSSAFFMYIGQIVYHMLVRYTKTDLIDQRRGVAARSGTDW